MTIDIESETYDKLAAVASRHGIATVPEFLAHIADSVSSGRGCIATIDKAPAASLKKSA